MRIFFTAAVRVGYLFRFFFFFVDVAVQICLRILKKFLTGFARAFKELYTSYILFLTRASTPLNQYNFGCHEKMLKKALA